MKKQKFLSRRKLVKTTTITMALLIAATLISGSAVSVTMVGNTTNLNVKNTSPLTEFSVATEWLTAAESATSQAMQPLPLSMLDWLHYDDGTCENALGLTAGGELTEAIRLTPTELAGYDGFEIQKVKVMHGWPTGTPQPAHDGFVRIWEAGTTTEPGALAKEQAFSAPAGNDWVEIDLVDPYTVDETQDVWVGVAWTHGAGDFPCGFDTDTVTVDKGGFLVYPGAAWTQLSAIGYPGNWNLWAGLEPGGPGGEHDVGVQSINEPSSGPAGVITPEVTVKNFGNNSETTDVQLMIGQFAPPVIVWSYGFEDWTVEGFTHPGWTNERLVGTDPDCYWQGHDSVHYIYPDADPYEGSVCALVDTGMITNYGETRAYMNTPFDFSSYGADALVLSGMFHKRAYGGTAQAGEIQVQVSLDGSTWTTAGTIDMYDAAYTNGLWQEDSVDLSAYKDETAVYLGFLGVDGGYSDILMDDLKLGTVSFVSEYDQTVTGVTVGVGATVDVTFPDWTPDDWQVSENVDITYEVIATTLLADDDPGNDQKTKSVTLNYPYLHDIAVLSINDPTSGPAQTLPVEVIIKNVGQFDECCYKTNVQIGAFDYVITGFFSDFEADDGGLTVSGGVWDWGEPTSGPMGAYSGTKLWATVLGGNYPTYANCQLVTTSIPVPVDGDLTFWHWYDIEASYDGGNVKISTNGGTSWTVITPIGGYTGTANSANPLYPEPIFCGHVQGYWEEETFDLVAYEGMSVMFRFDFGSDGSVQYPGWYIDDVLVGEVTVTVISEYDEDICTILLDPGEEATLTFPDWTPDALALGISGGINYGIIAEQQLSGDTNPANDQVSEGITLDYWHDVKVEDITSPAGDNRAIWDLQFEFDVAGASGAAGNTGVEWDGDYFYSCRWASNLMHQYTDTGAMLKEFSIPGVSGSRDFAYNDDDGYMYSGAAGTTVWEYDVISETLINSYSWPVAVRALAYDDIEDAFWCNNWGNDITLVDTSGTILYTIPNTISLYSLAFDNECGDPTLWLFSGTSGGLGCQVEQYVDIYTGGTLGPETHTVGAPGDLIAGGSGYTDSFVDGFSTLMVLGQGDGGLPDTIRCYEICVTGPPGAPTPDIFILPGTQSIEALVENAGVFVEAGMNVNAEIYEYITNTTSGTLVYDEDYTTGTIDPLGGQETATFPDYTFDNIAGVYLLTITVTLPADDMPNNNIMELGIGVDNVAPNSQHTIDPATPDGENGWYVSDVTLDFTANDGTEVWQSGLDHIEYRVNGGSWQTGISVTVTTDGEHTVQYKAIDNVGNEESANSVDFKIDQTVPIVDLQWESPDNVHVDFTAVCSDATSDMDYVEFLLNDGLMFTDNAAPFEWSIVWTPSLKTAIFKSIAYDMAGNNAFDTETGIEAYPVPHSTPNPVVRQTNPLL